MLLLLCSLHFSIFIKNEKLQRGLDMCHCLPDVEILFLYLYYQKCRGEIKCFPVQCLVIIQMKMRVIIRVLTHVIVLCFNKRTYVIVVCILLLFRSNFRMEFQEEISMMIIVISLTCKSILSSNKKYEIESLY